MLHWYVYILECRNGALYTGVTTNVKERIKKHQRGKGSRFTRSFKVKSLLYQEEYSSREDALKREFEIKGWSRKKKLALMSGNIDLLNKL